MANETMPKFEVPAEMRAFAEQSVAQAKKAFDGFMTAAQGAVSTFEGQAIAAQEGAKDVQRKAVTFAERNVASSFDFAQRLLAAKDPQEMLKHHADYVKAQMQVLSDQARELGEAVAKSAARRQKS